MGVTVATLGHMPRVLVIPLVPRRAYYCLTLLGLQSRFGDNWGQVT